MSEEEDLNCALQMLKSVQRRANSRDLAEGIAAERAKRKPEGSTAA
jgi:enoyl-CoA hydratase/carnithine racemase